MLQKIWKLHLSDVWPLALVAATVEGKSIGELAGYLAPGDQTVFEQVTSHPYYWKSMKKLLQHSWNGRTLYDEKFCRSLLQYHNTSLTVASILLLRCGEESFWRKPQCIEK